MTAALFIKFYSVVDRLVDDVDSAPGWSADGKRMAFVRSQDSPAGDSVIVADADGKNARVLAARTAPKGYSELSRVARPDVRPIWMPDGQSIVVVGVDLAGGGNPGVAIVAIDVKTGAESVLANGIYGGSADAPRWSITLAPAGHSFFASVEPTKLKRRRSYAFRCPAGESRRSLAI